MNRNKGIAISYAFTILNTAIGLFMSAFVIQMVGQAEYGVYQAITAFVSYLTLFELGTGNILNRNISLLKKDGTEQSKIIINKNVSTIWSITLTLSGIMLAAAVVFYSLIDSLYGNSLTPEQIAFGKPLFGLATVKLVVNFFTQTLNGGLIGFEHYSVPKTIAMGHLFLRTVIVAIFLFVYRSILLMVAIDTLLEMAVFITTFIYGRIKLNLRLTVRNFDKGIFVTALPLALALLFQAVINMANNTVDKFVISIMMPPENVAVYSVAMFIFVTFSALTVLPTSMYMPEVARNIRDELSGEELTETLVPPCRLAVVIGGMIVGGFIAVGRPFIILMYGCEYLDAWLIAVVIMVPMMISMTNCVVINVLDVLNKRLARSAILLCTAMLNIVLTVWWVCRWGMLGAASATALATMLGFMATNVYYSKVLKLKITYLLAQSYKGILWCLLIATLLAVGMTQLVGEAIGDFFVGGIVFVAAFCVFFLLFGANRSEKEKLAVLKRRICKY